MKTFRQILQEWRGGTLFAVFWSAAVVLMPEVPSGRIWDIPTAFALGCLTFAIIAGYRKQSRRVKLTTTYYFTTTRDWMFWIAASAFSGIFILSLVIAPRYGIRGEEMAGIILVGFMYYFVAAMFSSASNLAGGMFEKRKYPTQVLTPTMLCMGATVAIGLYSAVVEGLASTGAAGVTGAVLGFCGAQFCATLFDYFKPIRRQSE